MLLRGKKEAVFAKKTMKLPPLCVREVRYVVLADYYYATKRCSCTEQRLAYLALMISVRFFSSTEFKTSSKTATASGRAIAPSTGQGRKERTWGGGGKKSR